MPDDVDTARAEAVVAELGWRIRPWSAPLRQLAVAVRTLEALGVPAATEDLVPYGRALAPVAEAPGASART